jgi:uncharacterized cupin superfamily protein
VGIAHWDDVEPRRRDFGHLRGEWTDLGLAAGSVNVGVRRIRVSPGEIPTPAHVHGTDEEIFFVRSGSGLSWQGEKTYEVRENDVIVHVAMGEPHTLRAGDDGLEVLAFGHRMRTPGAYLPNAHRFWLLPTWTEVGDGVHPYEAEPKLDWPTPSARPPNIVHLDDAKGEEWRKGDGGGYVRALGASAGSIRTGLNHETIPAGLLNTAPHCHSAEEEIFVILAGDGVLRLGDDEHSVRAGHVVARPPGTGIPHAFRAGDGGLTMLSYGTREPNDIAYYPRSGVVALRGLKVFGRLLEVDPSEIR